MAGACAAGRLCRAVLLEPVAVVHAREPGACRAPLLQAAGVKSVIMVSEPYHLWRVERLARATGFDRAFDVQYAAAPTSCWRRWGMAVQGRIARAAGHREQCASNGYL